MEGVEAKSTPMEVTLANRQGGGTPGNSLVLPESSQGPSQPETYVCRAPEQTMA